ncbi:MAG: DUF6116 family protein [Acidobacteriota bacterium]
MTNVPSTFVTAIQRFIGQLKSSQLLLLVASLFAIDLFIPDPLPFIDEVVLGIVTLLISRWHSRREAEGVHDDARYSNKPPPKNVTPEG